MLFTSFEFVLFFSIVFCLYWALSHRWQNILLLIASYIFYGSWDWRFLLLLFFCTASSYLSAQQIIGSTGLKKRRWWLIGGIGCNVVVLGFFKYFNFFLENAQSLLGALHINLPKFALAIFLPIGLSFYTFQAISYIIDIYRRSMKPTGSFLEFTAFMSFFPQLIAGPIAKASGLLPQFVQKRQWKKEDFFQGSYLIFLGLFQKMFVADNMSRLAAPIFSSLSTHQGPDVLLALYAFTIQVYCDFAGYSNMARGLAQLLGFKLLINFNLPFWATSVQDFWNRWHMSLSQWVRDYLYFPLMGSLRNIKGNARVYAALMISMTLMGLWHGASWNFVLFGVYYGALLCLYIVMRYYCANWIQPKSQKGQSFWFYLRLVFMFHITTIAMTLFHCSSMAQIGEVISSLRVFYSLHDLSWDIYGKFIAFVLPMLVLEFIEFKTKDSFFVFTRLNWLTRSALFALMAYLIFGWGVMTAAEFVYFQF